VTPIESTDADGKREVVGSLAIRHLELSRVYLPHGKETGFELGPRS
jgi:hypothetical protein